MKKFIFLILIFFPALSFADWTLIPLDLDSDQIKARYFIDLKNLRSKGNKVRVWSMQDFNEPQVVGPHSYYSVKSLSEFNCNESKIRILAYSIYDSNMAKGEKLISKGSPFSWENIKKDTVNSIYLDLACKN
ncbi:MAG: surface-adhesin E family protein [Methylophilaceae bacterium]